MASCAGTCLDQSTQKGAVGRWAVLTLFCEIGVLPPSHLPLTACYLISRFGLGSLCHSFSKSLALHRLLFVLV